MEFCENQDKLSNNALILFSKLEQILQKKEIMIHFAKIRNYSSKKRVNRLNSIDIFQFNQFLKKQNSLCSSPTSAKLVNQKINITQAIQKMKIKSLTEQTQQSQYQICKTRQQLRNIIELEKTKKHIKQNLKDNKIVPKPLEERLYEISLALIFISFLFTITYTIIHELKE